MIKSIYIPYNNDLRTIEEINKLDIQNKYNLIFYFAPFPELTGTGRRFPNFNEFFEDNKLSSKLFNKHIEEFLDRCKKYGFETNLLLNNVLLGMPYSNKDLCDKIPKIQAFLERMQENDLISIITIGNPYLLELLNFKKLKNLKVKTSVNFQIKSHKSIDLLNNLVKFYFPANLYEIELQKDLLRDIPALKKIRQNLDGKVRLSILVNEGCLTGCPYQQVHQIHSCSFPSSELNNFDKDFNFGIARCKFITASERWRFLDSNWILPEQLKYYEGLIDSIKITGRDNDTETIVKTVIAYATQKYNENNINSLISLMRMEDWDLPKHIFPNDFDRILFEEVSSDYFKDIFNKLNSYNNEKGKSVTIKLKGFVKKKLHKKEEL